MAVRVSLTGASVQGRDHALVHKNCQDSYAFGSEPLGSWGVVSDGCGEGRRTELGAHLTTAYLSSQLRFMTQVPAFINESLPRYLAKKLEVFYRGLIADMVKVVDLQNPQSAEKSFAFDHLLCTVLGFFVQRDFGVLFWAGDGSYMLGDEVVNIDSGNQPKYPAYAILGGSEREITFESRLFCPKDVGRIAIATDGFNVPFGEVFDKTPNALKRWMNVTQKQERAFSDDATLVAATFTNEE
jgi:hypothetical protein